MSKIFSSLIPTTYPVSISSMQLSPKEEVLLVNQLLAQTGEYKFPFILQVVYDNNGWREYAAIFGKTKEGLFLAEPGHKSTENTRRYNYFHVMPFIGMDEDIPDMRKDVAYCSCEKNLTDVKNFVEFMVSGKHRAQIGLLKVFGKSTLSRKDRIERGITYYELR